LEVVQLKEYLKILNFNRIHAVIEDQLPTSYNWSAPIRNTTAIVI